ncbi:MAG TPA: CoA ester lyase [Cycloclasticus sp.]|jgi:citrate lyase subunit beta/citryl-CoA lyase|nr:CoA ester lyase [Cycloclasticus sp.]HIL92818.1 CoA ester lyase [Cycloclasticus sp.]
MTATKTLNRSVLFVPGSEQKRIEKAANIPADILVFDLEDAVSIPEKTAARQRVTDALKTSDFANRQCFVRINGVTTDWFIDDAQAVAELGTAGIMLPKCDSVDDLIQLKNASNGVNLPIFGIVETALSVLSVANIAKQMQSNDSLCFGHVDFASDMQLNDNDASKGAVYHARCQVALAARAFGITAIDNISLEVKDELAMREDALLGQQLGYSGKLCIHPRQVDIVNSVYTPTDEQVKKATEILARWEDAQKSGQGVFTYENKMVDLPVILAQESILARSKAITENSN